MNRIAKRTWVAMVLSVLLFAGLVFFLCEFMIKSKTWTMHEGSPHVYEDNGKLTCGAVVDRDGLLLLDANNGRVYSSDEGIRKSTVHWVGDTLGMIDAPVVPYYSEYLLDYDVFNGVYHYGDTSTVAQLTLSSYVQKVAVEALGEYKGTVAVYNYETGEIICAVTTPTFDPNDPPEVEGNVSGDYEGLYYNRFTQGLYIPGSIFKIVTLAAALEEMPELVNETFTCTGSCTYGPDVITCEDIHYDQTLQEAFRNSCNCAFSRLAERLGPQKLREYVEKFGVLDSVSFDGVTTAKGNFDISDAMDASVAWSAIGQHKDQINPCGFMTFMGAIAAGGQGVQPYVVDSILAGKHITYQASTTVGEPIMSRATAEILQSYLGLNVEEKYGSENFPGLTVCAKTGTGEVGGDKKSNAMFAGFVENSEYPLAFIICVEDGGYGKRICVPIASKVLEACQIALGGE